jgi:hypothetical protein
VVPKRTAIYSCAKAITLAAPRLIWGQPGGLQPVQVDGFHHIPQAGEAGRLGNVTADAGVVGAGNIVIGLRGGQRQGGQSRQQDQ